MYAISTLDDFYLCIGKTLDICQTIEYDVKLIYSNMHRGDPDKNFDEISSWTLGKVVNKLEELDYSDDNNLLKHSDYDILRDITDERNYIVHKIFLDFSYYEQGYERDRAFQKASRRLINFYNRIERLWQSIEKIRIANDRSEENVDNSPSNYVNGYFMYPTYTVSNLYLGNR